MAFNPVDTAFKVALFPARLGARLAGSLLGRDRPDPPPPAPKDLDDVTIARKVESTVFRESRASKSKVDVNVASGIVYLRGEVKTPDLIKELEADTRAIPEVRGVENLLHLPKTPAPTRTDTPPSQRKTHRSTRRVVEGKQSTDVSS